MLLPPLHSLEGGIILVQELLDGAWQLSHLLVRVQVPIDRLAAEVLQAGDVGGERAAEHQRDFLTPRVDVVGTLRVGGPPGLLGEGTRGRRHVVMHQLEDAVEAGHGLAAAGVALQREAAALTLDAQVLGA